MRFSRTSKALGLLAVAALALTGCGSAGSGSSGPTAAGDPNKIITAYSNEPQHPSSLPTPTRCTAAALSTSCSKA
ncbi:hypothetical protein AHiyo8_53090 [Arthrobacter sp. Hiyo8]|nr:hypothetical protein AHiyo8_53090 [Arthrobacter sp. Hiyo8]